MAEDPRFLLHFKTKNKFNEMLSNGTVSANRHLVFIKDSQEIWCRGTTYTAKLSGGKSAEPNKFVTGITVNGHSISVTNAQPTIGNISGLQSALDGKAPSSHTHTISQISDRNTGWDSLLKSAPSIYVTRHPTISEVTSKQNLVIKLNGGSTEGSNQFTYNATSAKSINITASNIGAASSNHNHTSLTNVTSITFKSSPTDNKGIDSVTESDQIDYLRFYSRDDENDGFRWEVGGSGSWRPAFTIMQLTGNDGLKVCAPGQYELKKVSLEGHSHSQYLDKNTSSSQTITGYCDFKGGAGNSGSDMRFKINVTQIEDVLDKVKNLDIINYKWNKKGEECDTFGLNASQVKDLFPKMWHQRYDEDKTEWIEYDRTGVIALKAIQELLNRIERIEEKMSTDF